jgi:hypothetical protein
MAFLLLIGITVVIVGFVVGGVFIIGREYDRHPWVKKFLDAQARTVPGYVPPDLPKSYTDQVPGGWDDRP